MKEIEPFLISSRLAYQTDSGASGGNRNRVRGKSLAKLLQTKTWWTPEANGCYARITNAQIQIGMGDGIGLGETCAGFELNNVAVVRVDGQALPGSPNQFSSRTKIGFLVDYHTSTGYAKRVFLGTTSTSRLITTLTENPSWGCANRPVARYPVGSRGPYLLNLRVWAPENWDGRCWFTVYMKDGGRNQSLQATVSW